MNLQTLKEAEFEAKRFLDKCKELRVAKESGTYHPSYFFRGGNKYTGAVKRSSMDLSRSLSKLRNTSAYEM